MQPTSAPGPSTVTAQPVPQHVQQLQPQNQPSVRVAKPVLTPIAQPPVAPVAAVPAALQAPAPAASSTGKVQVGPKAAAAPAPSPAASVELSASQEIPRVSTAASAASVATTASTNSSLTSAADEDPPGDEKKKKKAKDEDKPKKKKKKAADEADGDKEKSKDKKTKSKDKDGKKKKDKGEKTEKKKEKKAKKEEEREEPLEKAYLENVESYMEMLYEESTTTKIRGTSLLLQLVQDPANLDYFIENETIMQALSRVLSEERKKSAELNVKILNIFFYFSQFRQLHHILLQNKIGDTTMRIIELELKRYEIKMQDKSTKPSTSFVEKQDGLLFLCFYILLNLAEDAQIEHKMVERRLIQHLIRTLERKKSKKPHHQLHILVLTFFKKLSIFIENKNEMVQFDVIKKSMPYLESANEEVAEAALRLLFNLSFDPELRIQMVKSGMIPTCVELLKRSHVRTPALRLLYNISMDERLKQESDGGLSPAVSLITSLVIKCPEKVVDKELIALAINLSAGPRNVEMMVSSDHLPAILGRLKQTYDPLLMKLVRNMSDHPQSAGPLLRYLPDLVSLTVKAPSLKSQNNDFLVEAFGTLANLHAPQAPYAEILVKTGLAEFILKNLVLGLAEDDVLLQVVMLVGSIALHPKGAAMLASQRLARALNEILHEKIDDADIVLQTVYSTYRLLLHPSSREILATHDQLPGRLLDLMMDEEALIRTYTNQCLDIIMECDTPWCGEIRLKRFQIANRHWIQFMSQGELTDDRHSADPDNHMNLHLDPPSPTMLGSTSNTLMLAGPDSPTAFGGLNASMSHELGGGSPPDTPGPSVSPYGDRYYGHEQAMIQSYGYGD